MTKPTRLSIHLGAILTFSVLNAVLAAQQSVSPENIELETVTIGSQQWCIQNLAEDKFRNGDPILHAQTKRQWRRAIKNQQPAYCVLWSGTEHQDSARYAVEYGFLYNFYALTDDRGLAPNGFVIPCCDDWVALGKYLESNGMKAKDLMSKEGWYNRKNGTNKTGFNARPGGGVYSNGEFLPESTHADIWSAPSCQESSASYGCDYIHIDYIKRELQFCSLIDFGSGLSVRCLKEK